MGAVLKEDIVQCVGCGFGGGGHLDACDGGGTGFCGAPVEILDHCTMGPGGRRAGARAENRAHGSQKNHIGITEAKRKLKKVCEVTLELQTL